MRPLNRAATTLAAIATLAGLVTIAPPAVASGRSGLGRPIVRRYASAPLRQPLGLGTARYRAARDAGLALLARFPPADHYIVGVGRSPAPVIGFLKELTRRGRASAYEVGALAGTIPASGLAAGIALEDHPEYFRHFDRFLPDDVRRGERAVVLIDRISTSDSVRNLATVLEAYFTSRGVAARVIRSGFHGADAEREGGVPGLRSFPMARFRGATVSDGGGIAEFEAHRIGATSGRLEDLVSNPGHLDMRASVRAHMLVDETLDRRLRVRFPHLVSSTEPRAAPPGFTRARMWGMAPPRRSAAAGRRAAAPHPELAGRGYGDLRNAALDLLRRYPPDRYAYVGVGPGAAAMTAFLDAARLTPGYVPTPPSEAFNLDLKFDEPFREVLPPAAYTGRRSLLLISDADPEEMSSFVRTMTDAIYLVLLGARPVPAIEFVRLGLGAREPAAAIDLGRRPTVARMVRDGEAIAPRPTTNWNRFYWGLPKKEGGFYRDPSPRPAASYRAFRDAIRRRMETDEVLDRFLTTPIQVRIEAR